MVTTKLVSPLILFYDIPKPVFFHINTKRVANYIDVIICKNT